MQGFKTIYKKNLAPLSLLYFVIDDIKEISVFQQTLKYTLYKVLQNITKNLLFVIKTSPKIMILK